MGWSWCRGQHTQAEAQDSDRMDTGQEWKQGVQPSSSHCVLEPDLEFHCKLNGWQDPAW